MYHIHTLRHMYYVSGAGAAHHSGAPEFLVGFVLLDL